MKSSDCILKRTLQDRWMQFAAGILLILIAFVVLVPLISPWRVSTMSEEQFAGISKQHWLGTDFHGRDLLTRVASGLGLSLAVGCVGASVSLGIGVSYGLISGYAGGKTEAFMMRVVDVLYSVPRLVLVIVLISALEKPLNHFLGLSGGAAQARLLLLFVGLGCVEWLTMARIVRGQVRVLRTMPYITAAEAMGQSGVRILFTHLLPNLFGVILVYTTLTIPVIILEESFLSYLGLGIEPPSASLGTLIAEGAEQINPLKINVLPLLSPTFVMALLMLSLNILGDGLRDAIARK